MRPESFRAGCLHYSFFDPRANNLFGFASLLGNVTRFEVALRVNPVTDTMQSCRLSMRQHGL